MTISGVELIAAERRRQVSHEGFSAEHDAGHDKGELTAAAICYAAVAFEQVAAVHDVSNAEVPAEWPFDEESWKAADNPVRNLVKAGALIVAEIDRRLRGGS